MANNFVALIDSDSTKEQRDAITKWLRGLDGIGFWHHIEHSWIIAVPKHKSLTTAEIRSKLRELAPGVNNMVLAVDPGGWSGFSTRKSFEWLRKNL